MGVQISKGSYLENKYGRERLEAGALLGRCSIKSSLIGASLQETEREGVTFWFKIISS